MTSKIDEIEAIGKALQERKAEMPEPSMADLETWGNEGFAERVRDILLSGKMMDVDVTKIQIPAEGLGKFQFRRTREFDDLEKSIRVNGVLEPIILQQAGDLFYIIDGNTRFHLWREAVVEITDLPKPVFLVLDVPDTIAMQLAAELNRNGQNLNDEDESVLIIRLYEQGKMRQVDISVLLGMSKSYVSEVVSAFRDVPADARALIESGTWTVKHGRELARLRDYPNEQTRIMKQAIATSYDGAIMEEKVDSALAKLRWMKDAEKKLKAANLEGNIPGEEIKVLRSAQVEKVHKEILKDTTERRPSGYGSRDHQTVKVGKGEYEPTVAATTKILKKMGYEVLPGEAPAEKAPSEPEKPKMPTNDVLMEERYSRSICPICKGRTHPFVAEEIGFKVTTAYGSGGSGIAHLYCALQKRIDQHKKETKKLEDQLEKDDLALMIRGGESLEAINGRSHDIYKQELDARKAAWREKNLPQKAPKKTKNDADYHEPVSTVDIRESLSKASLEFADLDIALMKLREKQPKLVPSTHDYWDAYLRYKHQDEGWDSLPKVGAQLGISHQSVANQFQKLDKAVAAEGAQ